MTDTARWIALGDAGVIVSICYGPSGSARQNRWTVQAMGPNGDEFDLPYSARDAAHAIEIAEIEAKRRGWLPS